MIDWYIPCLEHRSTVAIEIFDKALRAVWPKNVAKVSKVVHKDAFFCYLQGKDQDV